MPSRSTAATELSTPPLIARTTRFIRSSPDQESIITFGNRITSLCKLQFGILSLPGRFGVQEDGVRESFSVIPLIPNRRASSASTSLQPTSRYPRRTAV